jgi:hypothetical protein
MVFKLRRMLLVVTAVRALDQFGLAAMQAVA